MLKRVVITGALLIAALTVFSSGTAKAAGPGQPADWARFYHYPYVYYPHNFQHTPQQYNHMYYKYPAERRIPVMNKNWHNFYTMPKPWHTGNHYRLDVF